MCKLYRFECTVCKREKAENVRECFFMLLQYIVARLIWRIVFVGEDNLNENAFEKIVIKGFPSRKPTLLFNEVLYLVLSFYSKVKILKVNDFRIMGIKQ